MSDEVLAYQIELPDKRISDIAIQVTEDDYLIAAGYYSDLFRSEDALSGYFFLKIDRETGEIPVKEIRQMGQEFYNLYSGQGNKPSRKDLERLKIRKILPVSGSACLLIAETEWSEERCETDVRTGQRICDTHYIFGPLILQHFSGSGSMDWLQFLRKFQHSAGDEAAYSSFLMHARPQLVTFYYNKPSEMGKGGKPARMDQDKNIVGYFRVDSGGQDEPGVSRTAGSYQAIPASALIWNGDLYFLGEKDGSRKLFKSGQQP
jgi:hypothetical protein